MLHVDEKIILPKMKDKIKNTDPTKGQISPFDYS